MSTRISTRMITLKSKIALETKNIVNKLSLFNEVIISWIPGHSGHPGNEVADNLAKLGANRIQEGPKAIIPIAEAVMTDEIKRLGINMHQRSQYAHVSRKE